MSTTPAPPAAAPPAARVAALRAARARAAYRSKQLASAATMLGIVAGAGVLGTLDHAAAHPVPAAPSTPTGARGWVSTPPSTPTRPTTGVGWTGGFPGPGRRDDSAGDGDAASRVPPRWGTAAGPTVPQVTTRGS